MEKNKKKAIRAEFRRSVFERDRYRCVCCDKPGMDRQGGEGHLAFHKKLIELANLDAHHICSRDLMPNGGYVAENGVSLCDECHIKAEDHWHGKAKYDGYSPEELYTKIGSSLELATTASDTMDKSLENT